MLSVGRAELKLLDIELTIGFFRISLKHCRYSDSTPFWRPDNLISSKVESYEKEE